MSYSYRASKISNLNPLVSESKSFAKDTNHFLSLLAKLDEIPDNVLLYTADVVGLYPSIPHGEGLEAMRKALDTKQSQSVCGFDVKVFKLRLGTAIGSKFAPVYANLLM